MRTVAERSTPPQLFMDSGLSLLSCRTGCDVSGWWATSLAVKTADSGPVLAVQLVPLLRSPVPFPVRLKELRVNVQQNELMHLRTVIDDLLWISKTVLIDLLCHSED